MKPALYAYEVWLAGPLERRSQVNARSAAAARYSYFLDAGEWCPDVKYIDVRARKAGPPVTTEGHRATMKSRGRPELVAGARVLVEGKPGFITGGNYSSNFDVLLDHLRFSLNVHPADITLENPT